MLNLILLEVLVDKSFSVLRRESHLVARLRFVEEVRSALQEAEDCVK